MGRWTYYSPSLLGAALAALLLVTYDEYLPVAGGWRYWLIIVGGCVGGGLVCQLAMVAAQGAFAQVLPAPGGRSIRGGGAVLAGWLLLLALLLILAGGLLALEEVTPAALVVGGAGVLALIAAGLTYAWCWPTAVRDFVDDR